MRMRTLREQGCEAKAIIRAYPYKEWKLSTGYAAERKAGSGRPKSVRTAPNIDRVEELICSQEGATETHRSTHQIAAELNISERSVRRIAREDLLHKLQPKPKMIAKLKAALQLIWDNMPQEPINKAVKDFTKRLKACVQVNGGHFEHLK